MGGRELQSCLGDRCEFWVPGYYACALRVIAGNLEQILSFINPDRVKETGKRSNNLKFE
jgi:hypothetical protein